MEMFEKTRVGKHEIWFDSSAGIVYEVFDGLLNADEMERLLGATTKWLEEGTPAFYLMDNRNLTGLTTDGRKAVALLGETLDRDTYCAIFGASFAVRTVLNMVFSARELTSRRPFKVVIRFVADASEARAWLVERKNVCAERVR